MKGMGGIIMKAFAFGFSRTRVSFLQVPVVGIMVFDGSLLVSSYLWKLTYGACHDCNAWGSKTAALFGWLR